MKADMATGHLIIAGIDTMKFGLAKAGAEEIYWRMLQRMINAFEGIRIIEGIGVIRW